ncbi:MAG: sigma factor-like helix-turn-helix DNA-binding protein [Candidatus Wallbacteria bacterium]|nr:sigma factor-like helix-turn-helix DNA-binding protein [Candidatus Wallbacteria bacterium]
MDQAIDCRNLLAGLDQKKRLLLTLKYLHELTSSEIAEQVRRPASTVRREIAEALEELRCNSGFP